MKKIEYFEKLIEDKGENLFLDEKNDQHSQIHIDYILNSFV